MVTATATKTMACINQVESNQNNHPMNQSTIQLCHIDLSSFLAPLQTNQYLSTNSKYILEANHTRHHQPSWEALQCILAGLCHSPPHATRVAIVERSAANATMWWCGDAIKLDSIGKWSYMGVSENGGFPQQPWVFLLKMIILGCEMGVAPFKETPIWG